MAKEPPVPAELGLLPGCTVLHNVDSIPKTVIAYLAPRTCPRRRLLNLHHRGETTACRETDRHPFAIHACGAKQNTSNAMTAMVPVAAARCKMYNVCAFLNRQRFSRAPLPDMKRDLRVRRLGSVELT